jgi:hypothetical protein
LRCIAVAVGRHGCRCLLSLVVEWRHSCVALRSSRSGIVMICLVEKYCWRVCRRNVGFSEDGGGEIFNQCRS